jgi:hypothetical protein
MNALNAYGNCVHSSMDSTFPVFLTLTFYRKINFNKICMAVYSCPTPRCVCSVNILTGRRKITICIEHNTFCAPLNLLVGCMSYLRGKQRLWILVGEFSVKVPCEKNRDDNVSFLSKILHAFLVSLMIFIDLAPSNTFSHIQQYYNI